MLITRHRAGLCAAALLGSVFLLRFAERVEHHSLAPAGDGTGEIVRSEVLTIYATERIIAFARAHGTFGTNEELARAIRGAGLGDSWLGLEIDQTTDEGNVEHMKQVVRPGEFTPWAVYTTSTLAKLGGSPTDSPLLDNRAAEVIVIDESYMKQDPFEALEELEEMRFAGRFSETRTRQRLGLKKHAARKSN